MSTPKLLVPEPVIQDRKFTKPLMCGPGPCDLWPSVIEALTKPVISPICDEYHEVNNVIQLRNIFTCVYVLLMKVFEF